MFAGDASDISRPPTPIEIYGDRFFQGTTRIVAWLSVALVFYVVVSIARVAMPAIEKYGTGFLTGTTWDANRAQYGILPAIVGTMYSSVLGLAIGTAFGLAIAVFLSERFLSTGLDAVVEWFGVEEHPVWGAIPDRTEDFLRLTVELLAAIPSVVYGLWGIFIVIPLI